MNKERKKQWKTALTDQLGATEQFFESDTFKRMMELDRMNTMDKVNDNPRIEHLADQAGMFRNKYGRYRDACDPTDGVDLEKFAELLIKECCDMFVELRTRPADLAVLDVKNHFGVE